MNELFKLIDERIKKYADYTTLKSVPAKVLSADDEWYIVKLIESNATYKVLNRSGSRVEVGDSISLFYHGDMIASNSAYIGAVIYRPDEGGQTTPELDILYGDSYTGDLSNHSGVMFTLYAQCDKQTNCLFMYSVNVNSDTQGEVTLTLYIDGIAHSFENTTTILADGYATPTLNLPLSLSQGVHEIWVVGSGIGVITDMNGCLMGHGIKNPFVATVSSDYIYTVLDDQIELDRYEGSALNPITIDSISDKTVKSLDDESFEDLDVTQVYISDGVEVIN